MSLLPGSPSTSSPGGFSGSEGFWVLVVDTVSQTPQLLNTILSSILFGVATSLAVATTYILLGKGLTTRGPLMLFLATLVLYTSTTLFCVAGYISAFAVQADEVAAANAAFAQDSQALFNPLRTANFVSRMSCIQTGALTINVFVGDAIVWWRASMIWRGLSRYVVLSLCAVLLSATFALSVVDTCGACNIALVSTSEGGLGRLFAGTRFGTAASILSLTTNVVATCLTGYKAWVHGRFLKQYLSEGSTMTSVERILILLTESGLAYGAIWVFVVAYQVGEMNLAIYSDGSSRVSYWLVAGYFVDGALVPLIAIYPMFIIVLVALKKSQMESSFAFTTHFTVNTRASQLRDPLSVTLESRSRSSRHASHLSGAGCRASAALVVLTQPGAESLHSQGTEDADTLSGMRGSKETV
ncbi:hypothetical protein K466DRAFT_652957 [Polyporus arcularius HHB13444]|uniref:Uncharacterized protein n=1 Tax=Polyporus arcularius HHB13444 TaxID=1314778 RepID=A0A5C3PDN2_9APHY|nr:hypothetical protein K466DRAFT_652957 [Polyporus arcularius HHB13444]